MFAELAKWWKRIGNLAAASPQDYRVYTIEFDRIIHGDELPALLGPEQETTFQVKASEFDPVLSRWRAAAELAAIEDVSACASKHSVDDLNDTVACLLVDHSGSLRVRQRAILATAVAEIVSDYWSRVGIRYEILGFTTLSWKGDRSREKWINSGRPPNPGRLCDLLHIVYRSADDQYTGPPRSIRNLIREELTKENVDGEAVAWAAGRLRNRHEARKILIVVSDGAPVDDSTLAANTPSYLERHLKKVIASINEAGDIWLVGIGLDYDVSRYYARHLSVASADEPSRVVRSIAEYTDVPVAPGPLRQSSQPGLDEDTGTKLTISGSFLALVAALLSLAVIMVMLPEFGRFAVFPFVVAGWLISRCLHEFGHAIVAYGSGDLSVRDKGYLTLDPLRYTNLQFSILWPLAFLAIGGIGLPGGAVYLNVWALRPSHRALISAAGPLATLSILTLLLVVLHVAEGALATPLYEALAFLAFLQLTALVLNLLPVPGLDGWGIVEPWLTSALRQMGRRVAGIAPALLLASFLFIPAVNKMLWRLIFEFCGMIGLDVEGALDGLELFQFWR
jgi:cobaltochelatase CobT